MSDAQRLSNIPPPLVAAAGWFVPGAGYWLIGQRSRALVVGSMIVLLYLMGLLIAGVRVVEVPGYDSQSGFQIRVRPVEVQGTDSRGVSVRMVQLRVIKPNDRMYATSSWALTGGEFISEIANKPWFAGQILAGPICLLSAAASVDLAQKNMVDYPRPHSHPETVGTLYTAIAGMLNLMVMIDAAYRAGQPATENGAEAE